MKTPVVVTILLLLNASAYAQHGHFGGGGHGGHSGGGSHSVGGHAFFHGHPANPGHSVFLSFFLNGHGSTDNQPPDESDCYELYMESAYILPELYQRQDFDSIHYWINRRTEYCPVSDDLFALKTLLAIQQDRFNPDELPVTGLYDLLERYASAVGHAASGYSDENRIYRLTSKWAYDLLGAKIMDSTESVLCRIFSGEIHHPARHIRGNRIQYELLNQKIRKDFLGYRAGPRPIVSFIAGIWMPNGKLSSLGVHPTIGLVLGGRNRLNEWDLVMDFRFINTPTPYKVLRQDSLYDRTYFFGGYVGIDYTRYFIHAPRFETGLIAGMGYDGFDISGSSNNSDEDNSDSYLKPTEIGSFNANLGIRLNYFLTKRSFIGLSVKYNFINYSNHGGTPLDGNAMSIHLIFGRN